MSCCYCLLLFCALVVIQHVLRKLCVCFVLGGSAGELGGDSGGRHEALAAEVDGQDGEDNSGEASLSVLSLLHNHRRSPSVRSATENLDARLLQEA